MHAEFSYAHFVWLFIVHTHHCTEKSQNLWNQVQEKKLHFLSIGLYGASMHDIEIPTQK